jgi:hypothetical protein
VGASCGGGVLFRGAGVGGVGLVIETWGLGFGRCLGMPVDFDLSILSEELVSKWRWLSTGL